MDVNNLQLEIEKLKYESVIQMETIQHLNERNSELMNDISKKSEYIQRISKWNENLQQLYEDLATDLTAKVKQYENMLKQKQDQISELEQQNQNLEKKLKQQQALYYKFVQENFPSSESSNPKRKSSNQLYDEYLQSRSKQFQSTIEILKKQKNLSKEEVIDEIMRGYLITSPHIHLFHEFFLEDQRKQAPQDHWIHEVLYLFASKQQNQQKIRDKVKQKLNDSFIPEQLRGQIWKFFIGNKMELSTKFVETFISGIQTGQHPQNTASLQQMIKADIDRTQQIQGKIEMQFEIQEILTAFACFRPDIGYIQGMIYPLLMLLMRMDKISAFKCFINLVFRSDLLKACYCFKKFKMDCYSDLFDTLMQKYAPKAYSKLKDFGISKLTYLVVWVYTVFVRQFSLDLSSKIWDFFIVQGDRAFFKVAISIIIIIEPDIVDTEFEECIKIIQNCCSNISEENLFAQFKKIKLSNDTYQELLDKTIQTRLAEYQSHQEPINGIDKQ